MKLGIGIDTGGTCTDAVLYDFETRTVVGKNKVLTTHHDLKIGILNALDGLDSRPYAVRRFSPDCPLPLPPTPVSRENSAVPACCCSD